MLGSLTGEYAELLSRLAVKQAPMEMGQELHVGQLSCCSQCRITPSLLHSSARCAQQAAHVESAALCTINPVQHILISADAKSDGSIAQTVIASSSNCSVHACCTLSDKGLDCL